MSILSIFSTRDIVFLVLYVISIFFSIIFLYSTYKKSTIPVSDKTRIQTLIRQAGRYSVAALQDNNAAIAILHGDYGAAYMYSLYDIYTEEEISKATDINLQEFKKEIQNTQAEVTRRMYESCPAVIPKKSSKILISASQSGL